MQFKLEKISFLRYAYCVLMAFLVGATTAPANAQQSVRVKVDNFVNAEMQKQSIPGLSLAVVKNGRIVLARGYGYANVEHRVPVRPETVFQAGSIGKQFTATAIMILVADGKLNLEDKISKYFPQSPRSWDSITIRQLLTHTSGLGDYPDDFNFHKNYTDDELIKVIQAQQLAFLPGEKWKYSNLGYDALGILISKITGKHFGKFFQERIFKPLGMTTARIISETDIVPNRAAGYLLYNGELKNHPWIAPTLNQTGSGPLYLSVPDLAKWDNALYGDKILSQAALAQMWTPAKLNDGKLAPYGFGWFLSEINGHRIIEHEGVWQGFTAHIARYIDDKLTVIVMDNLKTGKAERMAHEIAGIYNPQLAPPHYKLIPDKEPRVTVFAKDLMQKFAAGKADQNDFILTARTGFFPERARQFQSYLQPLGSPQKVQLVERQNQPDGTIYRYEFFYKDRTLLITLGLNKEGKITQIDAADNY